MFPLRVTLLLMVHSQAKLALDRCIRSAESLYNFQVKRFGRDKTKRTLGAP